MGSFHSAPHRWVYIDLWSVNQVGTVHPATDTVVGRYPVAGCEHNRPSSPTLHSQRSTIPRPLREALFTRHPGGAPSKPTISGAAGHHPPKYPESTETKRHPPQKPKNPAPKIAASCYDRHRRSRFGTHINLTGPARNQKIAEPGSH